MLKKLDPEKAMGMTIAQIASHLKWTNRKTRTLLDWWDRKNEEKANAEVMTLGALLRTIEVGIGVNVGHGFRRRGYRQQALVVSLKKIGITRVQTILMPRTTVTFEIIAAVPRQELLKRDVGMLGTLSDKALDQLCDGRDNKVITVAELLSMEREDFRGWHGTFSTASTFVLLERLGFTSKDGPFMITENDRRDALVKDLISSNGLTAAEAKKFVEIAAQRNWI